MLTQHNRKTACLSPDHTLAIRELGVWSGDETIFAIESLDLSIFILAIPQGQRNLFAFNLVR